MGAWRGKEKEETMNKKIKLLIIACFVLLACMTAVACKGNGMYDKYDKSGYNITVQYDANGSYFGNAGQLYVTDTYSQQNLKVNKDGKLELVLVSPESDARGGGNIHKIARDAIPGYSFVGWYTDREPVVDTDGNVVKDDKNNIIYSYSGKWDFSKKLELDPNKEYTANEPVVTLYAGWVKNPTVEIYDENEKLLGTYEIKNPTQGSSSAIKAPTLNLKKGEYDFGTLKGAYAWQERYVATADNGELYTYFFDGLYLDKDMNEKMPNSYTHPFVYDEETASITDNEVLKLYVNYDEVKGDCYKIYSAAQLYNNAKTDGNYELMADIEFTSLTPWPNIFINNEFTGSISGNGHTISGVSIESNANSQYFGMFKSISKDAKIQNVTFDGISALIDKAYRTPGARYAVVASSIEDGFKFENVEFTNVVLKIAASSAIQYSPEYEIGLICADGYTEELGISLDSFSFEVVTSVNDQTTLTITQNGNSLELEFVPIQQD